MMDIPSEEAQEREQQRAVILSLAGFSFTGIVALIILDATILPRLHFAVWFLLISFLAYTWSFNAQGYKSKRWQNEIAIGLLEAGGLSLVFAIVSILAASNFDSAFKLAGASLAVIVALSDLVIRARIETSYLFSLEKAKWQDEAKRVEGKQASLEAREGSPIEGALKRQREKVQ
jgi:hypothetical protein